MIPATNPPSSSSRPRLAASATRLKIRTTASLTASCPLDSSVRSSAGQPRKTARTAKTDVMTARPMNASRIPAPLTGLSVDSTTVSSRIGPNSPIAPPARMYVPKRVRSSPASRRTGIRVPIAVVASAEPV